MRLIDADALIEKVMDQYCQDCGRRKGIKNGKWKITYEIGDAPCRACGVGDVTDEIEDAPTIELDIIRCKDCKHADNKPIADGRFWCNRHGTYMYYCSDAERRTDECNANI